VQNPLLTGNFGELEEMADWVLAALRAAQNCKNPFIDVFCHQCMEWH
jgi:hypothetical protein